MLIHLHKLQQPPEAKKTAGGFAGFGSSSTTGTGSGVSVFAFGSTPAPTTFGEVSGGNKKTALPTTSSAMPSFITAPLGTTSTSFGAGTSFGAKPTTTVTPAPSPSTSTLFGQVKLTCMKGAYKWLIMLDN